MPEKNESGLSAEEQLAGAAGIVSQEKIDEIRKKVKGDTPANPDANTPAAPAAGVTPGAAPVATPGAPVAAAIPAAGSTIKVETAFGSQIFGGLDPGKEVKLSSFADVQAFAKDAYQLEIKDVNDFQTLLKELKESKAQAAEAEQYKTAAANFESTIKNLPEEIGLLMQAFVSGVDHKPLLAQMMQAQSLNFERDFDTYPELDMVNRFSDKPYTKEEYDAFEPGQRKVFKDLAKAKYDSAKTTYNATKQETHRSAQMTQQNVLNSVESSITQLRKVYPSMGDNQIKRVSEIMTGGLRDSLYNVDGTYKPDAAIKIAMQEFGAEAIKVQAQTIGQIVERLKGEGASAATENLIGRSDKPRGDVGHTLQDRTNVIAEEVKRQTSFLKRRQ